MSDTPRTDKLACTPVMPTTEKGYLAALRNWASLSRQIESELSAALQRAEKAEALAKEYRENGERLLAAADSWEAEALAAKDALSHYRAAEKALPEEPEPFLTGDGIDWVNYSDYQALRAHAAALQAERDAMREALLAAADYLDEAASSIEDWGSYAGEYFQVKHGLAHDIALYQQHARATKTAARKETP